jgi:hypothetical protein
MIKRFHLCYKSIILKDNFKFIISNFQNIVLITIGKVQNPLIIVKKISEVKKVIHLKNAYKK